ncbi:MAG TPA: hypothetical protein DDY72_00260 [Verrucomicrobia bacterium]|nr:hypothetical protein [Verrucomicrobiota bacterium]
MKMNLDEYFNGSRCEWLGINLYKGDISKSTDEDVITHVASYDLKTGGWNWRPVQWKRWCSFFKQIGVEATPQDRDATEAHGTPDDREKRRERLRLKLDACKPKGKDAQQEFDLARTKRACRISALRRNKSINWRKMLTDMKDGDVARSVREVFAVAGLGMSNHDGDAIGFIRSIITFPRVEFFENGRTLGCRFCDPDCFCDPFRLANWNAHSVDAGASARLLYLEDDDLADGFYTQAEDFLSFVSRTGEQFQCERAAGDLIAVVNRLLAVLTRAGIEHVDCVAIAYDKVEKALADLYTALLEAERRVHAEQNQGEALRQIQEKADKIDARTIKIDETTDKIQGTTGKIYGIVNWLKEAWETIRKRLNPKGGRKPDKEASEEMRRLFELLAERLKKILNDPKNTKERQSLSCVARWVLNDYLDSNYNKFDALKWGKKRGRKFDLGMAVKTFLRNFRNEEAYKEIVSNYLSPKGPNARKRPPSGATPAD